MVFSVYPIAFVAQILGSGSECGSPCAILEPRLTFEFIKPGFLVPPMTQSLSNIGRQFMLLLEIGSRELATIQTSVTGIAYLEQHWTAYLWATSLRVTELQESRYNGKTWPSLNTGYPHCQMSSNSHTLEDGGTNLQRSSSDYQGLHHFIHI